MRQREVGAVRGIGVVYQNLGGTHADEDGATDDGSTGDRDAGYRTLQAKVSLYETNSSGKFLPDIDDDC
jgi:hypothetical protein